MTDSRRQSPARGEHPDRRQFIRTLSAASVAAAGLGLVGRPLSADTAARLDPGAPMRIGMIGTEGHTYMVFQGLKDVPGAKITAYAFEDGDWSYNSDGSPRGGNYNLDRQRKWVQEQPWGKATNVYETYQEMLDREKLDIAVVALPYARNPFAAAAAAQRGIHVMVEKPIAVTYGDLEMLHTAVTQSGVALTAMFAMRFPPAYYTIKQMVAAGAIGAPIMARGQKSYKWGGERPWFYKHPEIYGSTILWVAIHAVDWLYWVMDSPVRRVSAFHGNLAHADYPGAQDNSVVTMEFASGATGAVTADFLRPEQAPTHGDDRLRVIGSGGVIEKNVAEGTVELITSSSGPRNVELQSPSAEWLADFVASLRGERQHLIGSEDPFEVTRICIAATEAARTGRVIEL